MIRHIVAWNFKPELSQEERLAAGQKVKDELEALKGVIPGIIELKVYLNLLASSNRDVVLDSLYESEAALENYQVHPEHERVATFVRGVMVDRACVDYCE
ncbi:MAG: Dabb family protein [Defluviitaleaceae bacterium]|nr:Dabb family protein [Defluviitaleaceae bacterium]